MDTFEDVMPDKSTFLHFRHLLKMDDLAVANFAVLNAALSEKDLSINRDLETMQTKKGNQWHFGMKAHIAAYVASSLVHTVERLADIMLTEAYLHEEETHALGDRGYHKKNRTIDECTEEGGPSVLTPTKKPAVGVLTVE
jgi:IS5 family transposase